MATYQCSDPIKIEPFFPGALRGRLRKVGIREHVFEKFLVDRALEGPMAIAVKRKSCLVQAPCVHQCIGRACVEAGRGRVLIGGKPGDVGDSPEIQNAAVFRFRAEKGLVEGRNQGCPLAFRSHIPPSEVGDRRDVRSFGNHGGIANLD